MRGQRARDKGPSLYYYRDESICLTPHTLWFKFPIPHIVPLGITSEHRTRNNHWSLPGVWHPNEQTERQSTDFCPEIRRSLYFFFWCQESMPGLHACKTSLSQWATCGPWKANFSECKHGHPLPCMNFSIPTERKRKLHILLKTMVEWISSRTGNNENSRAYNHKYETVDLD